MSRIRQAIAPKHSTASVFHNGDTAFNDGDIANLRRRVLKSTRTELGKDFSYNRVGQTESDSRFQ